MVRHSGILWKHSVLKTVQEYSLTLDVEFLVSQLLMRLSLANHAYPFYQIHAELDFK